MIAARLNTERAESGSESQVHSLEQALLEQGRLACPRSSSEAE